MDMGNMPRNRVVFIGVIILAVIIVGVVLALNLRPRPSANAVTLTVWGDEPKDAMEALAAAYRSVRPNVTIKYFQLNPSDYESILIKGFSAGQGPDVFLLGNHDLYKYKYLISPPAPTQISADMVNRSFPKAVTEDFVSKGQVLALPLYIDTLALVYNRDMLDQAGFASPPSTWKEVLDAIPSLRKLNAQGQITSAALAAGGSERTVEHATDILSLLMLQNGVEMSTADGSASFARSAKAKNALRFYLDFSNPSADVYTWNESQGKGMESFLAGKTAMVFAYKGDATTFKARNPFVNFALAPMPQIAEDQAVNYPSYKGIAVWKQSPVAAWGWDFALLAATNSAVNKAYLQASGRPPALRQLIDAMSKDGEVGLFARQSLTARSWPIPDEDKVRSIFSSGIQAALRGDSTLDDVLQTAEEQVNDLR